MCCHSPVPGQHLALVLEYLCTFAAGHWIPLVNSAKKWKRCNELVLYTQAHHSPNLKYWIPEATFLRHSSRGRKYPNPVCQHQMAMRRGGGGGGGGSTVGTCTMLCKNKCPKCIANYAATSIQCPSENPCRILRDPPGILQGQNTSRTHIRSWKDPWRILLNKDPGRKWSLYVADHCIELIPTSLQNWIAFLPPSCSLLCPDSSSFLALVMGSEPSPSSKKNQHHLICVYGVLYDTLNRGLMHLSMYYCVCLEMGTLAGQSSKCSKGLIMHWKYSLDDQHL